MNIVKIFSHLFKIWIYHWVPVCQFSGVSVTTKCADSWDLLSRAFSKSEASLLPDLFILAWPLIEVTSVKKAMSHFVQGLQCPPSSWKKKRHNPLYIWCCSIFFPRVESSYRDSSPLVAPFPSFKCSSKPEWYPGFHPGQRTKVIVAAWALISRGLPVTIVQTHWNWSSTSG